MVTYKHISDLHTLCSTVVYVDRHWHAKMRLWKRNDNSGLWDITDIADALPAPPPEPRKANFVRMENSKYPNAVDLVKSFVQVTATMPLQIDGYPNGSSSAFGLVINAEKGLVIVSRATVPYDMCDIEITIANSIIVEGKVRFMHPLQNYAIVQYDPSLVKAPVQSIKLSDRHVKQGDELIFFGFNQVSRPIMNKTSVTDITTVAVPRGCGAPRYRAINMDGVMIDTNLASQCGTGALLSEDGTVQALWLTYTGERMSDGKESSYYLGLAAPMLRTVLDRIQQGIRPNLRILDVEIQSIQMSEARIRGLSEG